MPSSSGKASLMSSTFPDRECRRRSHESRICVVANSVGGIADGRSERAKCLECLRLEKAL